MNIFSTGWSNGFDGPGRRLVFYLKGCNFNCRWCGSPESISHDHEIMFYPDKSDFCADACSHGAVDNDMRLDRDKCRKCADKACINTWHNRAFELAGSELAIQEILDRVLQSRDMFGDNGGVTFSGGEPTLQMEELLEVAQIIRNNSINIAIETNASSMDFNKLFSVFDLVFCDLKCVTLELHSKITGADNRAVLQNLRHPGEKVIRIPLIKELNFTEDEKGKILEFLPSTNAKRVELLRLHKLGYPKYKALGLPYPEIGMNPPDIKETQDFARLVRDAGIDCKVMN